MKNWRDFFMEVLKDFLSVRSLITLGVFFTIFFLVWQEKKIPDVIVRICDMLLGFWFGTKVASAIKNDKQKKEVER